MNNTHRRLFIFDNLKMYENEFKTWIDFREIFYDLNFISTYFKGTDTLKAHITNVNSFVEFQWILLLWIFSNKIVTVTTFKMNDSFWFLQCIWLHLLLIILYPIEWDKFVFLLSTIMVGNWWPFWSTVTLN